MIYVLGHQGLSWSEVTRKGLHAPIPSAKLSAKSGTKTSPFNTKTEIVFEVEGYSNQQRSQKAALILKRALNPDAVIFELPTEDMETDLIVEEIVKQIGDIAGYTNLGLYRRRQGKLC